MKKHSEKMAHKMKIASDGHKKKHHAKKHEMKKHHKKSK